MLGLWPLGARALGSFPFGGETGAHDLTSTEDLQKPVDYALAGDQLIKDRYREFDLRAPDVRERTTVSGAKVGRLSGGKPGYSTRTDSRGYD